MSNPVGNEQGKRWRRWRLRRLLNDFEDAARWDERCGGEDPESMREAPEAYRVAKQKLEAFLGLGHGRRVR